MKRTEKINLVLSNLKKYETNNLPVSKNSIQKLRINELNKLENIFLDTSVKVTQLKRPFCPAKNINELNKARKNYRMEICKYIFSHGYNLENLFYINIPVYEAIANFLDSKKELNL